MTKIYSALAGALLSVLALGPVAAQQLPTIPHRTCATQDADALQQAELVRLNPRYNPAKSNRPDPHFNRTAAVTYTLPIVIHVIHNGEAVGTGTNISQAQVQSQIDVLNEDYRNLNADSTLVPGPFKKRRADVQVQFVAATRDPNGATMLEPGIDRVNRNTKGFAAPPYTQAVINSTIKPATSWNPSQYINIWIMDLGGGLLGYAQFPDNTANLGGLSALGGSAATDGVVVLYSAFGRVGNLVAKFNKGRTLTHELGHWLGLRHIWGDASCGTDYCADTPTQQQSNFDCPSFPHVTCSNGPSGDMFMNYMDYVDDACMQMFSESQKDRMQAVMSAGTPRRAELVNSPVLCPSVVTATATNSGAVCPGGSVTLTATGPAGATYAWTGPNGFTSTTQNPVLTGVTAAAAGTYYVAVSVTTGACPGVASTVVVINSAPPTPALASSLTAVCPGGSAVLTAPNLAAGSLPSENFNGAATGWTLANAGLASTAWQYRTAPFTYGTALVNYSLDGSRFVLANSDIGGSGASTNTTLTSPAFSTVGYSALQVSFQQYYRYYTGDAAVVEASTDGGTTWASVATYSATQGTPTAPATATISLAAYANKPSVQLRWRYTATWGYYWAIDNVQFTGTATPPTYAWTLVGGNGLPATTNTASITVSPTQASVYRLTTSYAGATCTSTSTISVGIGSGTGTTTAATSGAACPGSSITLSTPTVAGATYAWTGPNGFISTTQNPVLTGVTAASAGTYTVTATTTTSTCTSVLTGTATVVINPVPPIPALTSTATAVCAGSSVVLSATNLGGTTSTPVYAWTLVSGNGLPTATTGATLTVSPTQASVYRLTVSYAGSTCTSTSTISVGINTGTGTTTAANSGAACPGSSITLSTPTVAGATYLWTGPNGYSSTTQNPVLTGVTAASAGIYTVTATGGTSGTCSSTATTTVVVNPAPPTPALTATATTTCPGSSVVLSATNLGGTTSTPVYAWTLVSGNGLPTATTGATLTVSPTQASVYRLTVSYAGSTCTSTSTISVGIGSTTTTAANSGAVCPGSSITLSTPTIAGATYAWTGPNGFISTTQNPVLTGVTAASAGTYTVTATAGTAGTCPATASTTVVVNAAPATPIITATGTLATGITLTSSATTGNQFFLNGLAIGGATGQTYVINPGTPNGVYTVVATGANGCTATSAAYTYTILATTSAQAATSLTVYPNPTPNGLLTIELSGYREAVQLTISNTLGQRVQERTLAPATLARPQALDLSALPTGVYVLQARTASGALEVRRIVRE